MSKLAHFFLPHQVNNHKAGMLQLNGLAMVIAAVVMFQTLLHVASTSPINILGYASNISVEEVIRLTNDKRKQNGLSEVNQNPLLTQAAQAKAADMINRSYWAHVAPDGTQPWKFINEVGYKYRYAGENLARDFKDPRSAIEAWMASPSHKQNMLSEKYNDIGVAVIDGLMNGTDTTIIVQLFGTKISDSVPVTKVAASEGSETPVPEVKPVTDQKELAEDVPVKKETLADLPAMPAAETKANLLSSFDLTKAVSLFLTLSLGTILIIDAFIVARKRIVRIGGRTFAHLAFIGMVIAIIIIAKAGKII